jgi:serine/threonine-protein kinase
MGAVYEAEHTGTGGRVALKVITGDLASNRAVVDRFQREAKAAGRIDTQYITKVYDTGVDRDTGLPFLAMECLSGEDLQGFLKRTGPVAPDLALRFIAQACIGLQKAHDANVVHRDIKPANMFLARREEGEIIIKLLDFGIAKVVMEQAQETESAGLTKTGTMLGSPLYMSPEQALGAKDINHQADLWSLGAALYQALAGRTPFDHIQSLGMLIVEISSGRIPPVQEFAPWVPPQVAAIVHGALRRNRAERFQSAADMLAAIKPLLPQGWSLHESMLGPVQPSARVNVQPRLPMPSTPSLPEIPLQELMHQQGPAPAPDNTPQRRWPVTESFPSSNHLLPQPPPHASSTGGAMARSYVNPQPRPSLSRALALVGAALLMTAVLGVGGGYFFLRKPPAVAADSEPKVTPPEAPPSAPPAPPPTTSAQAAAPTSTASAAPEPPLHKVGIVVIPGDVSAEVDGKPAQPKSGILEITGALGSTHTVRIFKYKYQTITNVVLTDTGPIPPKVELSFSVQRPQGASAQPNPGAKPASGPKRDFN